MSYKGNMERKKIMFCLSLLERLFYNTVRYIICWTHVDGHSWDIHTSHENHQIFIRYSHEHL